LAVSVSSLIAFIAALITGLSPTPALKADRVTLDHPTASRVQLSGPVSIAGTVTPASPRVRVFLQLKTASGWVDRSVAYTNDQGQFVLQVPTFWLGRHTWRASAGGQVHSSQERTVTVALRTPSKGSPKAFTFMSKARWNPCEPLPYWVNPLHAPANVRELIDSALQSVTEATGIEFSYQGPTNDVPWGKATNEGLPTYGINFAWTTPNKVRRLAGSTVAWGGAEAGADPNQYVRGGVALDATWDTASMSSVDRNAYWRNTLLHETGHVIGLNHVTDPGEVMRPTITKQADYGAGDLAGLAILGIDSGCFAADPSPVA
jgi:hypothetical protein